MLPGSCGPLEIERRIHRSARCRITRILQRAMLIEGLLFLLLFIAVGVFLDAMNLALAVLVALCIFVPCALAGTIRSLLDMRRDGPEADESMREP